MDIINAGQARRIASDWHSGQTSALLTFASTGFVRDDLRDEITTELMELEPGIDRRDLLALDKYVSRFGEAPWVDNWSAIRFDYTPVTVDQT